jgi:hypothetical protein
MVPADQKVSAMSPDKLALYTGLSLRTVQRLETGEDWLQWMRFEEGAPATTGGAAAQHQRARRSRTS